MNDTLVVSVLERSEYLCNKVKCVLPFENALLLDKLLQSDTVNVFHNDILYLIRESDVKYLNDIWVRKNSDRFALISESSEELLVLSIFRLEYLNCNFTVFHYVYSLIDISHSADTDQLCDLISAVKLFADIRIHLIQLLLF